MISIGRFLSRGGGGDAVERPDAGPNFVGSLLEAVRNGAVNYDEIRYREFQDQLAGFSKEISAVTTAEEYPPIAIRLAEVIVANRRGTEKFFREQNEELRSIVELMTRSLTVLGMDDTESTDKLKDLGKDFDRVQTLRDVAEFKVHFKQSLDEVQKAAERRHKKMVTEMSEIRQELANSKERLQQFQIDPSRDAVTGLPTRDEAHARISSLSDQNALSFVLVLTIPQLSLINAKYGHQAGNTILQGFRDYLRTRMGESGSIFRWSGNCFVAIFSKNEVPQEQGGDVVRRMVGSSNVNVGVEGKIVSVPICPKWLCLGRTEAITGALLVERIDRFTADLF